MSQGPAYPRLSRGGKPGSLHFCHVVECLADISVRIIESEDDLASGPATSVHDRSACPQVGESVKAVGLSAYRRSGDGAGFGTCEG